MLRDGKKKLTSWLLSVSKKLSLRTSLPADHLLPIVGAHRSSDRRTLQLLPTITLAFPLFLPHLGMKRDSFLALQLPWLEAVCKTAASRQNSTQIWIFPAHSLGVIPSSVLYASPRADTVMYASGLGDVCRGPKQSPAERKVKTPSYTQLQPVMLPLPPRHTLRLFLAEWPGAPPGYPLITI